MLKYRCYIKRVPWECRVLYHISVFCFVNNKVRLGKRNDQYYLADQKYKDKDKDLFIGLKEFVVGYSKAPKQPQSSARPICQSHAMTRTGSEPTTIALLHRSSPRYALRHSITTNTY